MILLFGRPITRPCRCCCYRQTWRVVAPRLTVRPTTPDLFIRRYVRAGVLKARLECEAVIVAYLYSPPFHIGQPPPDLAVSFVLHELRRRAARLRRFIDANQARYKALIR